MPKLGTDTLTGKSGEQYTFNVYDGKMRFNDFIPGVYLISNTGTDTESHIYLAHSDNVEVTLQKHDKQPCFDEHGYNRISFLQCQRGRESTRCRRPSSRVETSLQRVTDHVETLRSPALTVRTES